MAAKSSLGGTNRVRRRQQVKWAAGGMSAALVATGALMLASPGGAHAATDPGVGSSYAQAFQDTPRDGSLQVGVILGEAIAGHTNQVAKAQSQGLDLTAIGTSLKGYNCNTAPSATQQGLVPAPLQTETGEPNASQGVTQDPSYGISTESSSQPIPPSFGSTEYVQATSTPYGEADTSYGDVQVPGAPIEVTGMKSKAWSGLVNGQRVAGATADVGSVSLVGGTVQLSGLHWEVTYPSGDGAKPSASFSLGGLSIHGTKIALPDTSAAIQAANKILGLLGIQIVMPSITTANGVEFVGALQINVVPSDTRDQILNALINGTAPVVVPLEGSLENGAPGEPAPLVQALCNSDTPITVADVAVAGVDGAGSYTTSLGGVQATSGAAPTNPFNLSLGGFGGTLGSSQFVPGTPAEPGSLPALSGSGGLTTDAGNASLAPTSGSGSTGGSVSNGSAEPQTKGAQGSSQPIQPIAAAGYGAGGPLLGIGLGGLVALLLLAEGDRRLMRRAQHSTTFDDFQE